MSQGTRSRFFARPCSCRLDAESIFATCQRFAVDALETLGPAHSEKTYEDVLCNKLYAARIPVRRQASVCQTVDNHVVCTGIVDLEVDHCLILELKAGHSSITPEHRAQLQRYMRSMHASPRTDANLIGAIFLFSKHGVLHTWRTPDA
jgi:GxxExxY protein